MKKQFLQIVALFIIELMLFLPISFAFNVYNVQATDITSSSAKINWETDEDADGVVHYGKTEELGYEQRHIDYLLQHSLYLYDLEGGTKYYFAVESTNINGTTKIDNNSNNFHTFTTLDITPPEQVNGLIAESVGIDYVYINWNSVSASDLSHYIIYRDSVKVANTTQTSFNDTSLVADRAYSYKVSAVDTSNNEGSLSDTIIATTLEVDVAAPTITNVEVDEITDATATINWLTDENATSVVYYGLNQTLDKIKEDNNFVLNHIVVVTGLSKDNRYSYIASSCDKSGNCANSTIGEFEAGADLTPPTINATIPEYYNENTIDIIGSVEPYSKVRLYVNDMLLAVRALGSDETAEGKFEFYNIVLSQNNVIKIWAEDKAGNVNEEFYSLTVDVDEPVVDLEEIPSVVTEKNLTIKGSVNEFVIMNIYLITEEETIPEKITGLKADVGNNSVELSWDKNTEDEFSHYVVYRGDVGAIAITQPESYNSYKDVLVNSGENYTYQVSAVNKFGKEAPKSEPVTVLIPGGETDLPEPEEIVDVIGEKEATLSLNVSGGFSSSITLEEDEVYALKIEFIDKALNTVLIEKEITLDTKPPEIEITRPKKGAFIYENYANEVDIEGQTEPFAEVHLYIERTPLGFLNKSFDVSGLPNEIQNLPESELRADCRLAIGGTQFCSTGADFSTHADSSGYFKFENIDLTTWFGIGASVTEIPAREFSRERELKEETKTRLVFIATDNAGIRNALGITYRIGTCWSGNFSWELTPMLQYQSPSVLSMERLREDTEQIFFYFNYTYVGRGKDGKILPGAARGVSVTKACSDLDILRDPRFNISCQILSEAGQTVVNPEGKISYTVVKLNRLENMDKWLEDDWENFFEAVGNELTFPFKIRITYEHEVDGKEITEVQTTCQEITYVLDNSLVDPRKVLPDWVLYDMVDFLNDSIAEINKIQDELRKVIEYVAVGCVASFLLRLIWQIYRRWVSFFDEKKFMVGKVLDIEFETDNEEDKEYCQKVAEGIKQSYKLGDWSIKLKYFSDADLKKCFPTTALAWEREAKLYNLYRLSCDRLFGHSTPSKWTEEASEENLYTKLKLGTGCAVDQAVMGQPLRAVKCRDVAKDFLLDKEIFSLDDKCLVVKEGKKKALYTLGEVEARDYNLYTINKKIGDAEIASNYVIKQTENNYLTAQDKYCAEVCGITEVKQEKIPAEAEKFRWKGEEKTVVQSKDKSEPKWACMPAHECRTLKSKPSTKIQVDNTYLRGFTKDCFYNTEIGGTPEELKSSESISDDPNRRYECCCINAVKAPPSKYYKYDDLNRYTVKDEAGPESAFESKSEGDTPTGWKDMEWSYRYWKEKYETKGRGEGSITHYEYYPNRYIEGRDFPACFGQNSWLYDLGAKPGDGNLLVIDPAKQHISAFQCLHVAGIYNRLLLLKNIMSALSSCLITVRVTGRADTGVCKELFSQYICSLVWYVIQYWQQGCLPFGYGVDLTKSDNAIVEYVSAGFKSIWGSVEDSRTELMEEYGNAKLNNLLGASEEAIARKICLAAFGYDWELGLEDIIDVAYASPQASLVQKMTGTREFLTVDPETNKAKYEYRASWIINPGCDMRNYKVELSCVSRNEMDKYGYGDGFGGINCEKVQDPEGHDCDCLELSQEKLYTDFYNHPTKLAQGALEDRDHHKIVTDDYRYDHLKFTLSTDASISSELRERCFPEMHEDGVFYFPIRDKTIVDIAACYLDPSQGLFICRPGVEFWTEQGRAHFDGIMVNGEKAKKGEDIILFRGDDLIVEPIIRKLEGSPICLLIELKKPSMKEPPQYELITADGTHNYPFTIEENVQPVRTGQIPAEMTECEFTDKEKNKQGKDKPCVEIIGKKLWYRVISAPITWEQGLSVMFEDKWNESNGIGEGHETNPTVFDGKITLSSVSQDKMIFNNENKKIREWWNKELEGLVLEDQGVKIKIHSVGFDERIKAAEYNIKIEEAKEGEEQKWDLILSLRHTRDNSTDCSRYGDVIEYQGRRQEEKHYIKVEGEAGGLKPTVSIDVKSDVLPKDVPLKIKVTITSKKEIDIAKYEIRTPDNKRVREDVRLEDCDSYKVSGSYRKECEIELKEEDLKVAGDYSITVEAKDKDRNEDEDIEHFDVKCYGSIPGKGDFYGFCQKEECDLEAIPNPTVGCAKDYKCCRVGEI